MADSCPHCGVSLPIVRDGYCPECRRDLSESKHSLVGVRRPGTRNRPEHISEYFTIPDRILVLVAIVLAAGGPWLVIMWLRDSLRPGWYMLWFFALPIWTILAIVFAVTVAVCRRLGIALLKQPDDQKCDSRSRVD